MIRYLDGTHETVDVQDYPSILLYENVEYEAYPNHWHIFMEIIVPIENDYTVVCNNQPYTIDVGEMLIIAPGVVHSMPKKRGRRYIYQIDLTNFMVYNDFASIIALIQPAIVINEEAYPSIYKECINLFNDSVKEYQGNEAFKEVAIFSNLLKMFLLVGRTFAMQSDIFQDTPVAKQEEYMQKFLWLCEYINNHCTENLNVDDAANMIGFSKFYFSRLFKKFTGNTFYNYVNVCRINQASLLLLDPEKNITEIAISSGFNSISSFIRIFKIIKGCTPTEFRKIHNNN